MLCDSVLFQKLKIDCKERNLFVLVYNSCVGVKIGPTRNKMSGSESSES